MRTVNFEGKTFTLTQDTHCDVGINRDYQWMAHAKDKDGNECFVTWVEIDGFDNSDLSLACDWDKPHSVFYI